MISNASFIKTALSFPDALQQPHFELTSFRINKKIFATLDTKKNRVCIMLSPIEQSVFICHDLKVVYQLPNKWGAKGATYFELKTVPTNLLKDALKVAYQRLAQKSISYKKSSTKS